MIGLNFDIRHLLALLVVLLSLIITPVRNEDPDRWVWSGDSRERSRQARYQVFENGETNFVKPGGATFGVHGSGYVDRPVQGSYNPQRPFGVHGQGRPPRPINSGGIYGQGGNFGLGIYGPDGPILTGPSYGKERPFKYFDTCKCTERFNCNSHGVAYGHCDVGKQYCCYGKTVGPPPSRPIHSSDNGVLIGPDGPYDRPINNNNNQQYGGGGGNGILVGPGGPTGIIGRPPGRPNGASNGVLIGPGGPFDAPHNNVGNLYARSGQPN